MIRILLFYDWMLFCSDKYDMHIVRRVRIDTSNIEDNDPFFEDVEEPVKDP